MDMSISGTLTHSKAVFYLYTLQCWEKVDLREGCEERGAKGPIGVSFGRGCLPPMGKGPWKGLCKMNVSLTVERYGSKALTQNVEKDVRLAQHITTDVDFRAVLRGRWGRDHPRQRSAPPHCRSPNVILVQWNWTSATII